MSFVQTSVRAGLLRPFRKIGLFAAAHWPLPIQCRIGSGRTMYVDLRSAVGRGIYMRGEFDPSVFSPFERLLKAGDTFLDVGANVGYYSMRALDRVGLEGHIHAFEIDERPLRCLRKTIRRQGLVNIHLHEVAVAEHVGTVRLVREAESGNSHLSEEGHCQAVQIPSITLDEWHARNGEPPVHGIKLDIEGAEIGALRGAVKLLTRCKPVLVCEAWDGSNPTQSAAAVLLRSLGYSTDELADVHSPCIVARPNALCSS